MKKITSFGYACLMLFVFSIVKVNAQETITLEKALKNALDNNLQIKQVQFQASLSEQDVRQAKMNFFPTVNSGINSDFRWGSYFDQLTGSLNTKSVNSLDGNINSSAVIFQGFQRVNQVLVNKYLLL